MAFCLAFNEPELALGTCLLYVLDTSSSYFVLVLMLKFACQKDCWHGTACPAALEHFGSAALSWFFSAPAPPCSAAWNPMGCRGTACFTMLLTTGPEGLLLQRLEHLSPSFSTDLGVCKTVSHSSLAPSCCSAAVVLFFLSSACSPRGTDNIASWPSSGQQQGPSLTWGSFGTLLAQPTPMAPLLPKPCHRSPLHSTCGHRDLHRAIPRSWKQHHAPERRGCVKRCRDEISKVLILQRQRLAVVLSKG